jgi:DNA-binding transcriptional MerR regulator
MLRIGEAARALGICRHTLRRWEARGIVSSLRSPTGQRIYSREEITRMRLEMIRGWRSLPMGLTTPEDGAPLLDELSLEE